MTEMADFEMEELRVNSRGHRILRRRIERVDDPDYTDQWGGHTYFPQWTSIVERFMVTRLEDRTQLHLMDLRDCGTCGEHVQFELGEYGFAYTTTECQYPQGITTVVEINVPSGRLICDDDLRDAPQMEPSDDEQEEMASYNTVRGQAQMVEAYAKLGMAYGPCGNSCPSLFEVEPGKYVVSTWNEDDEDGPDGPAPGKQVAWFCTDLWAFSMADYDAYVAAGGPPLDEQNQNGTRSVIDVPPGRYRMTYHYGEADFDHDYYGAVTYAEFERIGDV